MDAVEIAKSCADRALESASFALEVALRPIDGAVTPATEAHLQKAIDQLRKSGDRGPSCRCSNGSPPICTSSWMHGAAAAPTSMR